MLHRPQRPIPQLIRRFIERSVLYNRQMLDLAERLSLPVVRMGEDISTDNLLSRMIELMEKQKS